MPHTSAAHTLPAAEPPPATAQPHWFTAPRDRVSITTVTLNDEGRVLLVRDPWQAPEWTLPTGTLHQGESVRQAAVRCVRERAALAVEPDRVTGAYKALAPLHLNLTWIAAPASDRPARHGALWVPIPEALELLRADDADQAPTGRPPLAQRLLDARAPFGTHMRLHRPRHQGTAQGAHRPPAR
ncbi:NUDIX hydrolase [Nocardiopsis sp. CNT312]|uniref:NUDIX hydrolase n=1 Tax=Nocardiopsis sp. CNT312 TaxID=1137268 RepID=UPI000490E80D|nr:NUDIX domain-containing protein [Nocardiopsis sp. CNT312]